MRILYPTIPEIKVAFEWASEFTSFNTLFMLADDMLDNKIITKKEHDEIIKFVNKIKIEKKKEVKINNEQADNN